MRLASQTLLLASLVLPTSLAFVLGPSLFADGKPALEKLEPKPLDDQLIHLETVEDLTETAANRLIEMSDFIRKRDFDRAKSYLTADFRGGAISTQKTLSTKNLHGDVTRTYIDCSAPAASDRDGYIESLADVVAPLTLIEHVFFKTRGARFTKDQTRGLIRYTFQILGTQESGRRWNFYGYGHGEVQLVDGKWHLSVALLDKLAITERDEAVFTDVSESAGVALQLPRLGKHGNSSFFWRGAAVADVDDDGRDDIFASTPYGNHLYKNMGNGEFADIASQSNLADGGEVTTPIFFDFDNDGDLDLFCGHCGWEKDGVPYGRTLQLMRNEGNGRFVDVTLKVGLGHSMFAYGASVADVNNDGFLDIYVPGYQHYGRLYPNSWHAATNGTPNALFMNRAGERFEEVAEKAGVKGTAWSYASAFADYDGDGDQDLYVANDYGDNNLFQNQGDGTFKDIAADTGVLDTGNGMAVMWSDLNHDGRLDLYVSNMASSAGNRILKKFMEKDGTEIEQKLYKLASGNSIFLQTESGAFERLPASFGGVQASWAWGVSVLDIDLDGLSDLYVANGFISGDSLKDT